MDSYNLNHHRNCDHWPKPLKTERTDGSTYIDRRSEYDIMGRPVRSKGRDGTFVFEYDPCGRLERIGPENEKSGERFWYDAAGNRMPWKTPEASYGKGNRLTVWGDRRFEYDGRGRLSAETRKGRLYRYEYDSSDQLISVDLDGERIVEYEYDAIRRRVAKRVGGLETRFFWEGYRLSRETFPDGTRRQYFYAASEDHSPVMFCDVKPNGEPANHTVHYNPTTILEMIGQFGSTFFPIPFFPIVFFYEKGMLGGFSAESIRSI